MNTRITELFGIQYPIIQGGMQWLATAEFAAAVSNAGGLGIINATRFQDKEGLAEEIRKTKTLTDKPFAVNISMLPHKDYKDNTDNYFAAAFEAGVPIIETSGRNPAEYVQACHDHGIKIMHKVPAVRYAKTVERAGVDAVTIVGFECAGHPGMDDVSTMALIPKAVEELKLPVISGGGIADSRGFMAALALGAEGVVMGTRFVATKECPIHENFKQRLIETEENGTMLVQKSLRNANRVSKNETSARTLEMENRGAGIDELLTVISGKIQRACYEDGNVEGCLFPIGECSGIIHDVKTVQEVFDEIVNGSEKILSRMQSILK
ncbi:NAD(P)H-dependent flavin oxidoreductase [Caproiciproducens sp. R1]|uniref:NAD(P)H-dependent flavin oxidoreductase n=1 Tax=Caproiciproducens sp. R1 TaxID=3435000 RepID=UPI004033526E|nr:nitronate monooxygenase [Oscillospiraceae bacterium]